MSNITNPIIEFRQVWRRFGRLEVLCGVDLAIERGKTTVVIGESGTGKSVLLKHMIGLLKPNKGQVYVDGQRVDRLSEKEWVAVRKRFGFLFQLGALFDSMTTAENVAFPLTEHTNYSTDQIENIVAKKLDLVGLDGLQPKRPAELSGGQRKRVALARAIALNPEIILYDEPTTGLDPIRADTINDMIIKLQKELNVTSIVVTHDMTSAFKVADRIIMLHDGKFIADGSAHDFHHASDLRVHRFVTGQTELENAVPLTEEVEHDRT
ncbi:MAG: ABC transporter ATP-binding protein [Planctomycetota bacterium]|jgi:phospholipid/cholesterol/gamma-HCH transport system ATP-binding protein